MTETEKALEASETRTAALIDALRDAEDMQLYIEQMARRGYCPVGWPDNMRARIHNVLHCLTAELTTAQRINGELEAALPTADNVLHLRKVAR